jgi:N-acetylmuramoyl-L-alanine amidase
MDLKKATSENIAGMKPDEKVIRSNGTVITLTQGDIDYAKKQVKSTPISLQESKSLIIHQYEMVKGSQNRPGNKLKEIKCVVWHWTAAPNQKPEHTIDWFKSGTVYGSAQFVLGVNGSILQAMPADELAYHVGSSQNDPASGKIYTDWAREKLGESYCKSNSSPNLCCIGLELNPSDKNGSFSKEIIESAIALTKKLAVDFPTIKYIATHHGVVGWKSCPLWYSAHPEDWAKIVEAVGLEGSPA